MTTDELDRELSERESAKAFALLSNAAFVVRPEHLRGTPRQIIDRIAGADDRRRHLVAELLECSFDDAA